MAPFPEPASDTADPGQLFVRYLDFYRETVIDKVTALDEADVRTSRLVSGWTPIELLSHLVHMERRWFVWGFAGVNIQEPWGDSGPGGRWQVPDDVTLAELVQRLHDVGEETRSVLEQHGLDAPAGLGGRFDDDPPTLAWICFHVLQEYARHAGHLDIAVELAGGPLGE